MRSRVYETAEHPYVRLSVASVDSRRRRSAADAGSVTLTADVGGSELTKGRVHPRVGSGHVVLDLKICTFSYLTLKESLLLLILPQGGTGKRHSATSRLRH